MTPRSWPEFIGSPRATCDVSKARGLPLAARWSLAFDSVVDGLNHCRCRAMSTAPSVSWTPCLCRANSLRWDSHAFRRQGAARREMRDPRECRMGLPRKDGDCNDESRKNPIAVWGL